MHKYIRLQNKISFSTYYHYYYYYYLVLLVGVFKWPIFPKYSTLSQDDQRKPLGRVVFTGQTLLLSPNQKSQKH